MYSKIEEFLLAIYSHKLHLEDMYDFQYVSSGMMELCEDVISCLIKTECRDIINVIQKTGIHFNISHGDVPQFSNLDDCVFKVPLLVRDCGLDDITFSQLGFMLRTKPRKEVADTKYGENQSKTAAQMGLCSIKNARIYPSYLGVAFCNLDSEEQRNLLPKLILYIPYIFNLYASRAKYEDVITSISFLSESTQKRRLTNIWHLITIVNKDLPYELQIIRY